MTRKELIQVALDAGFSLAEIKVHLVNIHQKKKAVNKKPTKGFNNTKGPRIIYGMNTNAM